MTILFEERELVRRVGVVIAVGLILFTYGCEAHLRQQLMLTTAKQSDQGAYLYYARRIHETQGAFVGDRNRMPAFPFLLSLVYRPGMTETEFLTRAQKFNVDLSIAILLAIFLIFRKLFPTQHALALLVGTAFGFFLYRAPLAQAELLYYFLNFCAFLLLLRILIAPRWYLAILGGAMVGFAQLAKASALPMLAIWMVVFLAQLFWEGGKRPHLRSKWRQLGFFLFVCVTFGAVIFPYAQTSKRMFGNYFYNVNSTYFWCDSWPEALAFTKAYRAGNFPGDELPSPRKYWREHSLKQIVGRIASGLKTLATRSAKATGYYKFVLLFAVMGGVRAAHDRNFLRRAIAAKPFAAGFCFLYFVSYLLLYAWYDAIVSDSRFVLSLFLPFVCVGSVVLLDFGGTRSFAIGARRLEFARVLVALLIALALIDCAYNALRIFRLAS